MTGTSYNQFCPVAMAAEILCSRWTLLILRELSAGSTRFNELRRGVPRMSPALLSKRLKELESAGLIHRASIAREPALVEYRLTPSGQELRPIIEAVGCWGHKWIEAKTVLGNLDHNLLMWDIRRHIDPHPMPEQRSTIQFIFADLAPVRRNYWLIVEPQEGVDLCTIDPGFDVDLYLATDVQTMTEIWMGYTGLARAREQGRLTVTGSSVLEGALKAWLKLSPFGRNGPPPPNESARILG